MRRLVALAAVLAAAVVATGGAAAPSTCPGPGCMPVGTFSLPVAAGGKAALYVVTFTGKARKATPVALTIIGASPPKNTLVTALESKPVVKNGVETATIYMSVSARPKKLALGAAASSLNFEGFAPGGQLGGATAKVKPTTCAVFKSKYPKAPIWQNYWSDQSYQGATDAAGLILEVLLGAHC